MNQKQVAENLAAVEAHFHSEAENEVAAALKLYTDDIVWEAPALNGLNRSYSGKEAVAENYRNSGRRCVTSSSRSCNASRRRIASSTTAL